MIDTENIKQALIAQNFINDKYEAYSTPWRVGSTLCEFLEKTISLGSRTPGAKFYYTTDDQHVRLHYGFDNSSIRYEFADIVIKKKKGAFHSSWLGHGYYDWTVAGFDVTIYSCYGGTVELAVTAMNNSINASRAAKDIKHSRALSIVKSLVNNTSLTESESRELLTYTSQNWYSLLSEVRKGA